MLKIRVLGAAAGGGFPQWNSNSVACNMARDGRATPQTQSSIAVTADDVNWCLLNASPDIRQQINDNTVLHPRDGLRHSPISSIILTNADVDHIAGLLSLRESQPFTIYASERVLSTLAENSIFNVLNPNFVSRKPISLNKHFCPETFDGQPLGLIIEAFLVPGKIALYKENVNSGKNLGTVDGDTIGLRISEKSSEKHFFYIPACARLSTDLKTRLNDAPIVFFDGTLYDDNEMISCQEGVKTGRRMGHMSISGPNGTIAKFEGLNIERKIFIHINNTNPVLLNESKERETVENADWEIAFDGMEIDLG